MGKTHFAERVLEEVFAENNNLSGLQVIQIDKVRQACIEEWRNSNPKKSMKDGIKETFQPCLKSF